MAKVDYQLALKRQKNSLQAYIALCLIFILIFGGYTYFKFNDYKTYKMAVAANEKEISLLKASTVDEKTAYDELKTSSEKLSSEIFKNLEGVFPAADNYTELNRSFDAFEESLNRSNNVFVISSIEYEDVQASEDTLYKYLPVRMTIESSKDNFAKFLRYIETSGALTDKIRLMDIQSIHMTQSDTGTINFSVKIHAYFQNING